ncbi:MAG: PKD domain-containing protein [Flavobacteriales bacterium]|nr:PKD domain-containing protein [Flavobacteriales bacterium]
MSNELSKFDESVRMALDGMELPYDASSWQGMNAKLDAQHSASSFRQSLRTAAIAAGILLSAGVFLYYYVQSSACDAKLVAKTLKIDRDSSYDGILAKSGLDSSNAAADGVSSRFTDELGGQNEDNGGGSLLAQNDERLSGQDSGSTNNNLTQNSSSNGDIRSNAQNRSGSNTQQSANRSSSGSVDPMASVQDLGANTDKNLRSDGTSGSAGEGSNAGNDGVHMVIASSTTVACEGMEVTFELDASEVDGIFLWNFGDGNFSNAPNPTHKYAKSGSYDISLSVTSKRDGKIRSTTMQERILINPKPKADFEWEFVNNPDNEPLVSFLNTSEMANECTWSFDEDETTTEINPTSSFTEKGRHAVRLVVENEFGCMDDKYAYISIDSDYNLMAPESMTPGIEGDNGEFMPQGLKKKDVDFKLTVYNDKQPIFETTSKFKPWDGSLPDGTIAVPGDYPWVVIIYNRYGEEEKYYSGTITITP